LKIVFYSPQFLPSIGGLQNVVRDWANGLTKLGCEIVVVTKTPVGDQPDAYGFEVVRNVGFWHTVRIMRTSDIVVMFNVALKAMPQVFFSSKPLMITHHSGLYYKGKWQPFQILKEWVANYIAKQNVACSYFVGKDYTSSKVIYSPYNESIFTNLGLPRNGDFLFVGRLVTDKGCDLLLRAFSGLSRTHSSTLTLTIIGTGPEEENLKKLVSQLDISPLVKFTGGMIPEKVAIEMNNHKVLIVPSNVEPFGIVVLEGLACGCKVIVSEKGGLVEAGGRYAKYLKQWDADELSKLMGESIMEPSITNQPCIKMHLANCNIENTSIQLKTVIDEVLHSACPS
jgi:glycogen(starch) synthase